MWSCNQVLEGPTCADFVIGQSTSGEFLLIASLSNYLYCPAIRNRLGRIFYYSSTTLAINPTLVLSVNFLLPKLYSYSSLSFFFLKVPILSRYCLVDFSVGCLSRGFTGKHPFINSLVSLVASSAVIWKLSFSGRNLSSLSPIASEDKISSFSNYPTLEIVS
jgi:hypothetical protein